MLIDLAPLVQALMALALAAITATTPYLAPLLRRYLNIRLTATQADALRSAADAGAKAAYGYIATNAASFRDVAVRDTALAKGVQHVMNSMPDALAALGITPEHVKAMVEARFGGLLATDPSVSINGAALNPTDENADASPSLMAGTVAGHDVGGSADITTKS